MINDTRRTDYALMSRRIENLMSMSISMAQCGLTMGMMALEAGARSMMATADALTGRAFARTLEQQDETN